MLLPGKIELWALGDVLGGLLRAGVSGTLSLIESKGRRVGTTHHVHLVGGLPAAVLSDGPRLGEVLSESGALPARAVNAAIERQAGGDTRLLGELLQELVVAPQSSIAEGVRKQTKARVDRLFSLGEANLRFHATAMEGTVLASLSRAARTVRPLDASEFLYGRPRRRSGPPAEGPRRDNDLALLGLGSKASKDEIRQAFRRLVHQHHPDRAGDDAERRHKNAIVARLAAAYSRLTATAS
jgi:DnaJ-domain-containing protein 1